MLGMITGGHQEGILITSVADSPTNRAS